MKVLIGTPIHKVKDYAISHWLKSVSELNYPADFLMVDNSPGPTYMEQVRKYCLDWHITHYRIEHIEINQEQGADERIGRSREIIRKTVLAGNYDAWMSWECDQILPADTLDKLIALLATGNYFMVSHNSWSRTIPNEANMNFGCALIKREALEKYGFLLTYPGMPDSWHGGEVWFKKQILKGGGSYLDVAGVIEPIYHLDH